MELFLIDKHVFKPSLRMPGSNVFVLEKSMHMSVCWWVGISSSHKSDGEIPLSFKTLLVV